MRTENRNALFYGVSLALVLLALTALTCEVCCSQAQAHDLVYQPNLNSGTYHDGYYWWYGHPYTRAKVYTCSRSSRCGCRRRCSWRWRYLQVPGYDYRSPARYRVDTDSIANGTWRGKLLEIVRQRDQYESRARASALEHNEFLETIKSLGLESNFGWQGYGYAPQYAQGFGSLFGYGGGGGYNTQFGAQAGGTQVAYRYTHDYADQYRNADLAALISRQQQYQELAQTNTAKAADSTADLIDRKGLRDSEVARLRASGEFNQRTIEAYGKAIAQALANAQPQERTITERTEITPEYQQQRVDVQGEDSARAEALLQFGLLLEQRCAECHGRDPDNIPQGINLLAPSSLTREQREKAWLALEEGKMPPEQTRDGRAIPPLAQTEKRLLQWGFGPPAL